MGNKVNKGVILDRIKNAFGLSGNSELARFLGVAPNTITNWYNRNSIDFDLIFPKCEGIDLNWLLTGKGDMVKRKITEKINENPDTQTKALAELLAQMYVDIKDLTEKLSQKIIENNNLRDEIEKLKGGGDPGDTSDRHNYNNDTRIVAKKGTK